MRTALGMKHPRSEGIDALEFVEQKSYIPYRSRTSLLTRFLRWAGRLRAVDHAPPERRVR